MLVAQPRTIHRIFEFISCVVTEHDHWVGPGCAHCRQITCRQRDGAKKNGTNSNVRPAKWVKALKKCRNGWVLIKANNKAMNFSGGIWLSERTRNNFRPSAG